jgi:hypothetical protein
LYFFEAATHSENQVPGNHKTNKEKHQKTFMFRIPNEHIAETGLELYKLFHAQVFQNRTFCVFCITIASETPDRLTTLFPSDELDPLSALVITNAPSSYSSSTSARDILVDVVGFRCDFAMSL